MKTKFLLALVVAFTFLLPSASWAGRADRFKGWYEILSRKDLATTKPYFLLDPDTLGNLWTRYGDGPLPADLEQYRNEAAILAGFTDRPLIFFGLEKGATIADGFISIQGGQGERMELRARPDGQYDMATKEKGVVSVYLLAAPKQNPDSN